MFTCPHVAPAPSCRVCTTQGQMGEISLERGPGKIEHLVLLPFLGPPLQTDGEEMTGTPLCCPAFLSFDRPGRTLRTTLSGVSW